MEEATVDQHLLTALKQLESYLSTLPVDCGEYWQTKATIRQLKRTLVFFSLTRLGDNLLTVADK